MLAVSEQVTIERFDPLLPQVLANPYPYYRYLQAHDPVHWGAPGNPNAEGCWYVLRLDDATMVLKDPRFGREVQRVLPPERQTPTPERFRPLFEMIAHWMIVRDPPAHTRLRRLVNKAFTPRMIEQLQPRMAQVANQLIDAVQDRGEMELIGDFARPFPVYLITDILGIPVEEREQFLPWSVTLAQAIEFRQSDAVYEKGTEAALALIDYLRGVIAVRRQNPRDDLLSTLLAVEVDGSKLSEDEIIGMVTLLLTAGNDPTMHMIGNNTLNLLRHPEQLAWLQRHPERIEQAVDELLRYDSSVQMTFRYALEDVELGGKTIRTGDHIAVVLGAANHDPAHYTDPDRLDLTRQPKRYVPFGVGIHFCLGATLARLEGQIGLQTLLQRLPDLALQHETVEWQETASVRGLKALPLRFTPN